MNSVLYTSSESFEFQDSYPIFFMETGLNPYLFLTLLQKFMLHPQSHINESLQFQIYSIQDTHKNSTPQ